MPRRDTNSDPDAELPQPDDTELDELEAEYRRRPKPVRVRRRRAADWLGPVRRNLRLVAYGLAAILLAVGLNLLLFHSPWFVLAGSRQIAVVGAEHASKAQMLDAFSSDYGRDVFFIPLTQRRKTIEAIPWVRNAAVLRLWPARLEVQIEERSPVAFARAGSGLALVDSEGVILPQPSGGNYDFPVIDGLAGAGASDEDSALWRAQRATQMQQYAALMTALRTDGGQDWKISEVDLGEPDDARVRVSPAAGGASVLVHLGNEQYASRYAVFLSQIGGWQKTYPYIASVDLRYDGQAIVDSGAPPAPAKPAAKTAAKPAPKTPAKATRKTRGRRG